MRGPGQLGAGDQSLELRRRKQARRLPEPAVPNGPQPLRRQAGIQESVQTGCDLIRRLTVEALDVHHPRTGDLGQLGAGHQLHLGQRFQLRTRQDVAFNLPGSDSDPTRVGDVRRTLILIMGSSQQVSRYRLDRGVAGSRLP